MGIAMSAKELDRTIVLRNVQEGLISKTKAASTLSLSVRQVHRLLCRLQTDGPGGLISKKRGQRSNRAISDYKPKFANRKGIDQTINKFHFLMHSNIPVINESACLL